MQLENSNGAIIKLKKSLPSGVIFLTSNKNGCLISCEKTTINKQKIYEKFISKKQNDHIEITTNSSNRFGHIIYSGDIISTDEALRHFGFKIIYENNYHPPISKL